MPLTASAALWVGITIPQAPPTNLDGTVVDSLGHPVANGRVWIASTFDPTHPLASTQTDGLGSYRLRCPPNYRDLALFAIAEGKARTRAFAPADPRGRCQQITLVDAVALTGAVADVRGRPVADAQLFAVHADRTPGFDVEATGRTVADGSFRLDAVPLGEVELRAWHPDRGWANTRIRVFDPDGVEGIRLALEPGETTLLAAVQNFQPGTRYRLEELPPGRRPVPAALAEQGLCAFQPDGHLRITRLPLAHYRLHIEPPDGWLVEPTSLDFRICDPPDPRFRLVREPTQAIKVCGRVRDGGGRPIAHVGVLDNDSRRRIVTDQDGAFEFAFPSSATRDTWLRFERAAWAATRQSKNLRISGARFTIPDPTRPVEIRVVPAASITGTTLDARGHPMPLAKVTASTGHRTTSDTRGRFQLAGMPTGPGAREVQLQIHSRWIPPSRVEPVTVALAPGAQVEDVELRADLSHSIAGVARDATGEPIAGAKVWLQLDVPGRRRPTPERAVRTDRQGRFRFDRLPEANFTIVDDHSASTWTIDTGKGVTTDLRITVPR